MATLVDFSNATGQTINIEGPLYTSVDGVTFIYHDFGDTASVYPNGVGPSGEAGIEGTANVDDSSFDGYLQILFGAPVFGLQFNFTFMAPGGGLLPDYDGVSVSLLNGGTPVGSNTFLTPDSGIGTASFLSTTLDEADVFFDPGTGATTFQVYDVEYGSPSGSVPEPGTYALLGSGLFLLGCGSRKLLKRRS